MTRAPIVMLTCLLAGASAWGAEWKEQPLPAIGRPGDQLGASVAVGKDVIAVGAYLSDAGGRDSGSVYLFKRGPGGSWVLSGQRLDGAPGEWFGFDVAIDAAGTVLIVGAPNPGKGTGAVYAVDINTGGRTALLQGAQKGDELGSSVAIDGNRVAAGARGADRRAGRAYVLGLSGGARTIVSPNSKAGREFGQSVSLSGDALVVGEPLPGEDRRSPGAAYLFDLGAAGNPIELKPSTQLAAGSAYGYAVAVRNRKVLVGAPLSGSQDGAVYGFDCDGACAPRPLQFEAGRGDQLGVAIAMSGNTAVVGARGARSKAGAAFLHALGSASLGAALPHSPTPGAEFGFGAAIHEDVIVVGAFKQGGGGAAYVFELEEDVVVPSQTISLSFSPAASAARQVREGDTALVNVMLSTSDGKTAAKPFTVQVSTQDGTASAPGDYTAAFVTRELSQARPGKILTLRIPTVGDSVLEADETFKVVLASSTAGVVVQGPAEVTILDDDCVQLILSPVSVAEGAAPALYNVHLPQASASAVTLIFTSTNPGVTVGPSVTFLPGDQDEAVAISGDDAICNEEPPSFTVRVTAVSDDPDFACIQEDLTVTLTGDDDPCVEVLSSVCTSGGTVLYTWEIANTGDFPLTGASGPEISEQLPEEMTVVAASADIGVATVDNVENEMAWNGSIPPSTTATIETLAALEPGVTPGTDLGFEATYSYAGGEVTFEVPFVVGEADTCPPPPIE